MAAILGCPRPADMTCEYPACVEEGHCQPDPLPQIRHILSPRPTPNGRSNLCGAEGVDYGGLDEAYRANVEGWTEGTQTCRDCLKVALIAMGVSP